MDRSFTPTLAVLAELLAEKGIKTVRTPTATLVGWFGGEDEDLVLEYAVLGEGSGITVIGTNQRLIPLEHYASVLFELSKRREYPVQGSADVEDAADGGQGVRLSARTALPLLGFSLSREYVKAVLAVHTSALLELLREVPEAVAAAEATIDDEQLQAYLGRAEDDRN